jgi:enoyl-CoA hydratase
MTLNNYVLREDRGALATLTLNRPDKLNALSVGLFLDLDLHIRAIGAQPDTIGAVVVRGAGRCFSAGHDLGDIETGEETPMPHYQAHVIERLADLAQPVIMAVHGYCYTGALELALAGDLILAAESARFADTHAKWSLVPIWGLSQRLPRRVGPYKAREMMLTCRSYTGRQAEAMGLAERCVPDDQFERELADLVASIVANSWHSLRANKRLLLQTDSCSLQEGLAHEIYRSEGYGADFRERVRGFFADKPWRGGVP